jgi:hypothetical protein
MVIIRFPDKETDLKALGYVAGRFSGKSWSNGEMMVPESALPHLTAEGIPFTVIGPPTAEHIGPSFRVAGPVEVL